MTTHIIDLDIADLTAIGDSPVCIIIKKGDKYARVNVRLATNGDRVKAAINSIGPNGMTEKVIHAKFSWTKNVHGDLDYLVGDERRHVCINCPKEPS